MGYWGRRLGVQETPRDLLIEDYPTVHWLASTAFGKRHWGLTPDGHIVLALVSYDKGSQECIAKLMGESMHPYYYDCPLKVLRAAEPGGNSEWRGLCWQHHNDRRKQAKRVKSLAPGDRFKLAEGYRDRGQVFTVTLCKPLRARDPRGKVWSIPKAAVGEILGPHPLDQRGICK